MKGGLVSVRFSLYKGGVKRKSAPFLFAIFMAFFMGLFMSLVMTAVNTGLEGDFFVRWMRAFGVGFSVALPTALCVAPLVRWLVAKILGNEDE